MSAIRSAQVLDPSWIKVVMKMTIMEEGRAAHNQCLRSFEWRQFVALAYLRSLLLLDRPLRVDERHNSSEAMIAHENLGHQTIKEYGQLTNWPIVLHRSRYVRARPIMASLVSSSPHLSPGTVTARDWRRATGRELEFMKVAAAMAKFL